MSTNPYNQNLVSRNESHPLLAQTIDDDDEAVDDERRPPLSITLAELMMSITSRTKVTMRIMLMSRSIMTIWSFEVRSI